MSTLTYSKEVIVKKPVDLGQISAYYIVAALMVLGMGLSGYVWDYLV